MKEKILDELELLAYFTGRIWCQQQNIEHPGWNIILGALFLEQNTGVVVCSAVEGICWWFLHERYCQKSPFAGILKQAEFFEKQKKI